MQVDFEKIRVGDVFRSRKNRVFRVMYNGELQVAKVYPSAKSVTAREESRLLKRCRELGLRVPTLVELVGGTIVMTYLGGPNLADVADRTLSNEATSEAEGGMLPDRMADGLADWLASFHKAFEHSFCRGDTILRNFLESDGAVYGLDFEEAHKGDPITDLGELCANILGMRPLLGRRNAQLAKSIVNRYWTLTGRDRSTDLPDAIASGLEHYARFRDDGKVLGNWALRFRREGPGLLEELAANP